MIAILIMLSGFSAAILVAQWVVKYKIDKGVEGW